MVTEDGSTVVDLQVIEQRQQRRRMEMQRVWTMAHQLRSQQEPNSMDVAAMLVEFEMILAKRIQDAVHTLDTRQAVWKQTILQLQGQVQEQETILQERIQVHEHRVLKAGDNSHGMGTNASGTGGTLRG